MDNHTLQQLRKAQKNEITEYHIYTRLSASMSGNNREVMQRIAHQEKEHYHFWQRLTGVEVAPSRLKIEWYLMLAKLLGITFALKLMERGEVDAQETYAKLALHVPEAEHIVQEEDRHEEELIALVDEERLRYMGSMVRGLNDALVELTGAVAGLTFVLGTTSLIALTGLITGTAASLSMAGSEYLGSKSERESKDPRRAALYTGSAYLLVVVFLILPYALMSNVYGALAAMLVNALVVIVLFAFYVSVARDEPFAHRFAEMAAISLGIAAVTFAIGYVIRQVAGISV